MQQPAGAIAAAPAGATAYTIPQYATTARYIQAAPATQAAAAAQLQTGGIAYTAAGAVAAPQQIAYTAGTQLLDPYQQTALPNTYGVRKIFVFSTETWRKLSAVCYNLCN